MTTLIDEIDIPHNVLRTPGMRLLRDLVVQGRGLSREALPVAAALVIELERSIKDRAENDEYGERLV